MAFGAAQERWDHTAALIWTISNIVSGEGAEQTSPVDFNPYRVNEKKGTVQQSETGFWDQLKMAQALPDDNSKTEAAKAIFNGIKQGT